MAALRVFVDTLRILSVGTLSARASVFSAALARTPRKHRHDLFREFVVFLLQRGEHKRERLHLVASSEGFRNFLRDLDWIGLLVESFAVEVREQQNLQASFRLRFIELDAPQTRLHDVFGAALAVGKDGHVAALQSDALSEHPATAQDVYFAIVGQRIELGKLLLHVGVFSSDGIEFEILEVELGVPSFTLPLHVSEGQLPLSFVPVILRRASSGSRTRESVVHEDSRHLVVLHASFRDLTQHADFVVELGGFLAVFWLAVHEDEHVELFHARLGVLALRFQEVAELEDVPVSIGRAVDSSNERVVSLHPLAGSGREIEATRISLFQSQNASLGASQIIPRMIAPFHSSIICSFGIRTRFGFDIFPRGVVPPSIVFLFVAFSAAPQKVSFSRVHTVRLVEDGQVQRALRSSQS